MTEPWNLSPPRRRRTDWWKRASILIAGGALMLTASTAGATLAIKFVDWRITEQLSPVRESLARIEGALGIPAAVTLAGRK